MIKNNIMLGEQKNYDIITLVIIMKKIKNLKLISTLVLVPAGIFILELWVEHDSDIFYRDFLSWILKWHFMHVPVIYIIFFISIMYLIIQFSLAEKKEKISQIENTNTELLNKINNLEEKQNNYAKLLWKNHKELTGIKQDEILAETIHKYLVNTPKVQAVQIYKHTSQYFNNHIKTKINYVNGFADENVNINSITQAYHKLEVIFYDEFKECINTINSFGSDGNVDLDEVINTVSKFINTYISKLTDKDIDDITLDDANTYAVFNLTLDKLYSTIDDDLNLSILDNQELQDKLNSYKVELFNSILLEDIYMFSYEKEDSSQGKHNRLYVSFPIEYSDEQQRLLLSFDSTTVSTEEAVSLTSSLHSSIENSLVKWYNVNKILEEGA